MPDTRPAAPGGRARLQLVNSLFGTCPRVVHAHGHHRNHPHWPPIRTAFFEQPPCALPSSPRLTIITCNNGHPAMGLLERGLERLGLGCRVGGHGIDPWVNARDKPRVITDLLGAVETTHVLYADSRDALILDDPDRLVDLFESEFDAAIVFGADRMSWPPLPRFKRFERSMASGQPGDFHYLNGGMWVGRTDFCRSLFAEAMDTPAPAEAPESEQGILRELWLQRPDAITLDYRCRMFQNLGFVSTPILHLEAGPAAAPTAHG